MSEADKNSHVGDLVLKYVEARNSGELLRQKLQRCGSELKQFAELLSTGKFATQQVEISRGYVEGLGLEKVKSLLYEYEQPEVRAKDFQQRLQNLGISLK